MNEETIRPWAGPKGTIHYTQQGNQEPPVPVPLHKPLQINQELRQELAYWTWKNRLARECYRREGKGVIENPRRVRSVYQEQ